MRKFKIFLNSHISALVRPWFLTSSIANSTASERGTEVKRLSTGRIPPGVFGIQRLNTIPHILLEALERRMAEDDSLIVRSPFADVAKEIVLPDVSYPEFLLACIRKNLNFLGDRVALVDAVRDQSIKFKDIEPFATRIANVLKKRGFKKGDVLFCVTYNAALLYTVQLGVQLCGGVIIGCYQKEEPDEFYREMRDSKSRFILCEPETEEMVKMAAGRLDWSVTYFSIDGAVEGASAVEEMAYESEESDMTEYNKDVTIDPEEDILRIFWTSGSTGHPKAVIHTHRSMMALIASTGAPIDLERENMGCQTTLSVLGNFNIGNYVVIHHALVLGNTFVSICKYEKDSFFRFIDQYKPYHIISFVSLVNLINQLPEWDARDVSFVKHMMLTGSVVNTFTIETLSKQFPFAKLDGAYGMTETLTVSSSYFYHHYKIINDPEKEALYKMKVMRIGEESYVSNGVLLPLVEAKIVDVDSGTTVERGVKGRLLVRTPCVMKGYLGNSEKQGYRSMRDEHGWFDTGDLGFFDDDGHLYIVERVSAIFKYFTHMVSPSEIEGVIRQLPSVQTVGVVGVPDVTTTSAARAYVVIKAGWTTSEEEIKNHVAENLPSYKHLHGGVVFMDELPETRSAKVDRLALLNQAIQEANF